MGETDMKMQGPGNVYNINISKKGIKIQTQKRLITLSTWW